MAEKEEEKGGLQQLMSITKNVIGNDMDRFIPEEFKLGPEEMDKIFGTLGSAFSHVSKYLNGDSKSSVKGEERTKKMLVVLPVKDKVVAFIVNREKYMTILLEEKNMSKAVVGSMVYSKELLELIQEIMQGKLPDL